MSATAFHQLIASKQFTVASDQQTVDSLFAKVLVQVFGKIEGLSFMGLQSWTAEEFSQLACALAFCPELESLCLNMMEITDERLSSFCSVLSPDTLHNLKELDFIHNKIGETGVEALVGLFSQGALPQLENLNLSENLLGDEALNVLVKGLTIKMLPKLRELHVSRNKIGFQAPSRCSLHWQKTRGCFRP